jgi:hypothetical protein
LVRNRLRGLIVSLPIIGPGVISISVAGNVGQDRTAIDRIVGGAKLGAR